MLAGFLRFWLAGKGVAACQEEEPRRCAIAGDTQRGVSCAGL
jgi:hypothetical protein